MSFIIGRSTRVACALAAALALQAPVAKAADIFTLRLFNIDDHMSAFITNSAATNQLILQADLLQDTGFVDVTSFVMPGVNDIMITASNTDGIWSYGYDFQLNGITVDSASCGVAGVSGCQGDDRTTGLVYSHDPEVDNGVVAIPEPGTWALLILGAGLAGAAIRRSRQPRPAPTA